MSEVGDGEDDANSVPDALGDAEACKELNQEDLLNRVRSVFTGCCTNDCLARTTCVYTATFSGVFQVDKHFFRLTERI